MSQAQLTLWPVHPKPLSDELLSSWLVRLAHANGQKVQTFCKVIFGNRRQIWNRDIDRLAPGWLIETLSRYTAAPADAVYQSTLRTYEGTLYPAYREVGILHWILNLTLYHRTLAGHGLQFCPACLASDATPYFRKRWRVGLYTVCAEHRVRLLDACPHCDSPVAFHRIEMGKRGQLREIPLSTCHACGFDLRDAVPAASRIYGCGVDDALIGVCDTFESGGLFDLRASPLEWMLVLHQLVKLICTPRAGVHLREFVEHQLHAPEVNLRPGKVAFELRRATERLHVLKLAIWVALDLESRLHQAWQAHALRYNHMLKDFDDAPAWYREVTGKFSNWRDISAPKTPAC